MSTIPGSLPLALLAGLAAGAVHVLSGPDHLAAVLPFASGGRRPAALMGLLWGAGHSIGVLVLASLAMILSGLIDLDGISGYAERFVGFLLVGLGVWTLHRARLVVVHAHPHAHPSAPDGAEQHAHPHVHIGDGTVDAPEHPKTGAHARHRHSVLAFGLVHGVAGTSHLVGVAPALVLATGPALAYLLAFLVGSGLAMAGFAAAAGSIVQGRSAGQLRRGLQLSGSFALVVGGFWIMRGLA